jgi:hypothetical protein
VGGGSGGRHRRRGRHDKPAGQRVHQRPAPAEVRAGVIAVSGTARNLAKAVSPLAVGVVVGAFGYAAGFLAAGSLCVAGSAVLFVSFAGSAGGGAVGAPAAGPPSAARERAAGEP